VTFSSLVGRWLHDLDVKARDVALCELSEILHTIHIKLTTPSLAIVGYVANQSTELLKGIKGLDLKGI